MEEKKNFNLGKEKQSGSMDGGKNHHESNTNPVSLDGKLSEKLKILKSTEEIKEGAEMMTSPTKKSHFCRECNKGFSSGKALGGHMSSGHVQARENLKKLKFSKSTKFKTGGSNCDATKETVCLICGKDFPSRKSLFGHMRCHPDREYRGMEPPKEQEKITRDLSRSLSIDDDDDNDAEEEEEEEECMESDNQADYHVDATADRAATLTTVVDVVDLTKSSGSWTTKGKRGREGVRLHLLGIDPLSDEEEQKVQAAVDQLISLINGDSLQAYHKEYNSDSFSTLNGQIKEAVNGAGSKKKRVDPVHPARDRRDFPVKKRRFNETAIYSEETLDGKLDKGKGKVPTKPEFTDEISPSSQSRDIVLAAKCGKNNFSSAHGLDKMRIEQQNHRFYDEFCMGNVVVKNKRKRQKVTSMTSETGVEITSADKKLDAEEIPKKFKCSACFKTFSTHQALGGHRSSHNKLKVTVQNTADGSSPFPVWDENHANSVCQAVESDEIGGEDASKLVENIHKCKICKKTFPIGQALGGHKRCHWLGLSSQVTSPKAGETDQASLGKVL